MGALLILIFLMILGGMGGGMFYIVKILPQKKKQVNNGIQVDLPDTAGGVTVQDFLPFDGIENAAIYLGDDRYRAIIECTSVNYFLMDQEEQERLESAFRGLLNSCDFPFAMHVITVDVDERHILEVTYNDIEKIPGEWGQVKKYGDFYRQCVEDDIAHGGGNGIKLRKKYFIVGSEQVGRLFGKQQSLQIRKETALETLRTRCKTIIGGLGNCGVTATRLDTHGVVDLMYQVLNKRRGELTEGISNGSYLANIVYGTDANNNIDFDDNDLQAFFGDLIFKIETSLKNDRYASNAKREGIELLLQDIKEMKISKRNYITNSEQEGFAQKKSPVYISPYPSARPVENDNVLGEVSERDRYNHFEDELNDDDWSVEL